MWWNPFLHLQKQSINGGSSTEQMSWPHHKWWTKWWSSTKSVIGRKQSIQGISKSPICCTFTKSLAIRMLSARWLPRLLTIEHKQRRTDILMFGPVPQQLRQLFASIHIFGWYMAPLFYTWHEKTVKSMDWKGNSIPNS